MPVWQGQGYNSGIRDANNLGWKLAMVVKGLAGASLLDTYTVERRAHARSMIHLSEVAGDIFAPNTAFGRRFRDLFVRSFTLFPSVKRYFVEMRFKPMPRYEAGVVLLPEQKHSGGWLARLLERSGNSAPGRLLGLMSEKRDSFLGQLAYGRDRLAGSPVGRLFIQPRVRSADGQPMLLDDAIGNGFVVLGWGTDPTFGLTPHARALAERIGIRFVIGKPDVQLRYGDDVPEGVSAIGDVTGRIKDWFSRIPQSVVLLRPDRFVAGVCTPQQVSDAIVELAGKLGTTAAAASDSAAAEAPPSPRPARDPIAVAQTAGA
jgi:3-(3-hydroxy-phenyl)propionate hydroxylase